MKTYSYYFLFVFSIQLSAQNALNVSLFDQYNRGDTRYSGSWCYVDFETRKEYALLGTRTGTAIYDIDNTPIQELAFIPAPPSNWREITVVGQYAYVTTEGQGEGSGMQIIDLSKLPASAALVNTYNATFTTGHIIQKDTYNEVPYLYVMGVCINCGVNILDISNPAEPMEVGVYNPGYYIHDAHIRGDTLYAAAFLEGTIDIVDISDKATPTLITRIDDPGGNTHSAWTTEDNRFLIISDELDGLPARIWNIEDFSNLFEVATYTANPLSLTHNPYVRGDFCFFSHNTEGLRVVDIHDASLPVEVGFYDTFDGESGGFKGLWSACPFYPSGKIIGGNREDGLYVWTFNNTRAGRFYIQVRDSISQEILPTASIFIQKINRSLTPDLRGQFKFGSLPGNFRLDVEAEGYEPKTIEIPIKSGDSLVFDILLNASSSVGLWNVGVEIPQLEVFPNPFSDYCIFSLKDYQEASFLRIFNYDGQMVREEKVEKNTDFILNRNDLASGVYFSSLHNASSEIIAKAKIVVLD